MHSRAAFFRTKNPFECQRDLGSSQKPKRSQRQILFYFFLNIIKVISCVFIAPKSFPGAAIFLAFFYSQSGSSSDSQNTCSSRSPSEPASEKISLELFMLSLLLCTLKIYLIAAMNKCCLSWDPSALFTLQFLLYLLVYMIKAPTSTLASQFTFRSNKKCSERTSEKSIHNSIIHVHWLIINWLESSKASLHSRRITRKGQLAKNFSLGC